jgi:hypothetical protein
MFTIAYNRTYRVRVGLLANWKGFERNRNGLIKVLSRHLPGGTEETAAKTASIHSALVEVRIGHLTNTRMGRYHYINLFGSVNR